MPKQKTHSGAKKRFNVKKDGSVKFTKMNKRHILTKKSPKRKMKARQGVYLRSTKQSKTIARLVKG